MCRILNTGQVGFPVNIYQSNTWTVRTIGISFDSRIFNANFLQVYSRFTEQTDGVRNRADMITFLAFSMKIILQWWCLRYSQASNQLQDFFTRLIFRHKPDLSMKQQKYIKISGRQKTTQNLWSERNGFVI